jgi:hypothetical protein
MVGWQINDEFEKNLGGSGLELIRIPSRLMPGKTEENCKICQDSWCPSQDLNQAPPKYKPRALLLHQSVGLWDINKYYSILGHSYFYSCGCSSHLHDWPSFTNVVQCDKVKSLLIIILLNVWMRKQEIGLKWHTSASSLCWWC